MKKQKCPSCAKKIEKEFNYCPWCGAGIKNIKQKNDYGILGKNDNVDGSMFSQGVKLPFGMDKMVNSLMKQLEKEMGGMGKNMNENPQGFNIKIHANQPISVGQPQPQKKQGPVFKITEEERQRRIALPKKEAISRVKRLADNIIYEIEAPNVKDQSEVAITKLEKGFEIRVFTKDICYVKNVSLNMQLVSVKVKKDLVLVEFKS